MSKHSVLEHLRSLASMYSKLGDNRRAGSFVRAASAIEESSIENIEDPSELHSLHGVGDSTVQVVRQFLSTGTSDRYKELEEKLKDTESLKDDRASKMKAAMDKIAKFRKN